MKIPRENLQGVIAMNWSRFRCISVAPFGLGVALLMGLGAMGAQAPGGPPAPSKSQSRSGTG